MSTFPITQCISKLSYQCVITDWKSSTELCRWYSDAACRLRTAVPAEHFVLHAAQLAQLNPSAVTIVWKPGRGAPLAAE